MVKTAKCRQMYTTVDGYGDGYRLPHVTIPPRTGTAGTLLMVPAVGPCSRRQGPWFIMD